MVLQTPAWKPWVHASALGLAIGISFEMFIRGSPWGLQFPLWVLLFIAGLRWIGRAGDAQGKPRVSWWELQLTFFASWVAIRDNALLTAMNVGICLWLAAVHCSQYPSFAPPMTSLAALVWRPLKLYVTAPFTAIKALNVGSAHPPSRVFRQYGGAMLRSLFFMLPVGWLFVGLLNSADPSFGNALTQFFTPSVQRDLSVSPFFITAVTGLAMGLALQAHRKIDNESEPAEPVLTFVGYFEAMATLTLVNGLFTLFTFIQTHRALFDDALESSETYASRARGGFFQLLVVCALTFALILFFRRYTEVSSRARDKMLKVQFSLMVGLTVLILVSALARISAYEDAYGLTEGRLFSHVFAVFLGAGLGWCAVTLWWKSPWFAGGLAAIASAYVAAMNVLNPDAMIARHHFEQPRMMNTDVRYILSLSKDAVPYLLHSQSFRNAISLEKWNEWCALPNNEEPIWSFNLARYRARREKSLNLCPDPTYTLRGNP